MLPIQKVDSHAVRCDHKSGIETILSVANIFWFGFSGCGGGKEEFHPSSKANYVALVIGRREYKRTYSLRIEGWKATTIRSTRKREREG